MSHYYTPLDVARALAKHVPKNLDTVLEPAVGTGDLLQPLRHRLQSSSEIVCIDKDSKALDQLETAFSPLLGARLKIINTDFLSWWPQDSGMESNGFHCVLTNPPFAGKRGELVNFDGSAEISKFKGGGKAVPIEVAFVIKSVGLLRPGGRLLAIVPSSIIASLSTKWLREHLLAAGAVKYVHELPRFTFKALGSRVYLFVFEKQRPQQSLILLNHDLAEPESIQLKKRDLIVDLRLDYGFYNARNWFKELEERKKRFEWKPVSEVADVLRGDVASPIGAKHAIHTTDYVDGFWTDGDRRKYLRRGTTSHRVRYNDLIVKRVGKNCSKTFGTVTSACGYASSDCVVIIRPHKSSDRIKLLFALRTTLASEYGSALLERGTGAPYLTVAELPNVQIPINLADIYYRAFSKYQIAVRHRKIDDMLVIEDQVRKTFSKGD